MVNRAVGHGGGVAGEPSPPPSYQQSIAHATVCIVPDVVNLGGRIAFTGGTITSGSAAMEICAWWVSRLVTRILAMALPLGVLATPAGAAEPGGLRLGPLEIAGEGPDLLDLGVGAFNIQGHRGSAPAAEGSIEYRFGRKLFHVGPVLGLLANTQGGAYAYAGIYGDLRLGRVVLTPLGAFGAYHRGGSEDLGGAFQFRLGITAAYELGNRSRIGLQFAHISNADIHDRNPGDNEILLTYAIPFGRVF
jgi:lipid A 3-O-deacylase